VKKHHQAKGLTLLSIEFWVIPDQVRDDGNVKRMTGMEKEWEHFCLLVKNTKQGRYLSLGKAERLRVEQVELYARVGGRLIFVIFE